MDVTLIVNGAAHTLSVEPTETVVNILRDRLGLIADAEGRARGNKRKTLKAVDL